MMLAMVQAYSGNFPKHHPSVATPSKDVVMITGTTGGLGAVLLAELITSNDVIRVLLSIGKILAEPHFLTGKRLRWNAKV